MNRVCDDPHLARVVSLEPLEVGRRILVAAGDPVLRRFVAASMEPAGHHVDVVEDGEAAWKALLANVYDLMITDHLMPGASGLALVRQMRVAEIVLPVIVVSATLDAADAFRLSHDPWARVDACVHKPFTAAELLGVVRSVLADSRPVSPSTV